MKRIFFLLLPCLLLVGCEKGSDIYFPASTWVLANWNNSNGRMLTLDFDGDCKMKVRDADMKKIPFNESSNWTYKAYRISGDSVLSISYQNYYYDEQYNTKTYKLNFSMRDHGRTLFLTYQPKNLFSPSEAITYTFVRR
ncbi:MAG: hypothetical protein SPJ13_05250 [Bacteroidales bacterium]|nr:hypothetical protein [Bacteroidales bacterium]